MNNKTKKNKVVFDGLYFLRRITAYTKIDTINISMMGLWKAKVSYLYLTELANSNKTL